MCFVIVLQQRLKRKSFLLALKQKDWNEKRVCCPNNYAFINSVTSIIITIADIYVTKLLNFH